MSSTKSTNLKNRRNDTMKITFCGKYENYDDKTAVKWQEGGYELCIEGSGGESSNEISVESILNDDKLKLKGDLKNKIEVVANKFGKRAKLNRKFINVKSKLAEIFGSGKN